MPSCQEDRAPNNTSIHKILRDYLCFHHWQVQKSNHTGLNWNWIWSWTAAKTGKSNTYFFEVIMQTTNQLVWRRSQSLLPWLTVEDFCS